MIKSIASNHTLEACKALAFNLQNRNPVNDHPL